MSCVFWIEIKGMQNFTCVLLIPLIRVFVHGLFLLKLITLRPVMQMYVTEYSAARYGSSIGTVLFLFFISFVGIYTVA
jgi:hypothetical protein